MRQILLIALFGVTLLTSCDKEDDEPFDSEVAAIPLKAQDAFIRRAKLKQRCCRSYSLKVEMNPNGTNEIGAVKARILNAKELPLASGSSLTLTPEGNGKQVVYFSNNMTFKEEAELAGLVLSYEVTVYDKRGKKIEDRRGEDLLDDEWIIDFYETEDLVTMVAPGGGGEITVIAIASALLEKSKAGDSKLGDALEKAIKSSGLNPKAVANGGGLNKLNETYREQNGGNVNYGELIEQVIPTLTNEKGAFDNRLAIGVLIRLRKRPDLLTAEWDECIDQSISMLQENPL